MKILNKKSLTKEWVTPDALDESKIVPSFEIRPLTNIQNLRLKDLMVASAVEQKDMPVSAMRLTHDVVLFLLRCGWSGWKDMPDGYEWSGDIMENIEALDHEAMDWLSAHIYHKSTLTESDKKKS